MTQPDAPTTDPAPPAADDEVTPPPPGLVLGYRVIAYVVGVFLLLLCASMILRYGFDDHSMVWVGQLHGLLYMIYVVITFLLGQRLRWPLGRLVMNLLAGTIPFLSFVAERRVVAEVRALS